MENTGHNGYNCPMCRTEMASFPDEENSDDDEDMIILRETYNEEDVLTSFRMFHQTISGEEVEEEDEEDEVDEEVVDDISSETSDLSDDEVEDSIDYNELEKYMLSKQISYKNLLETLLYTLDPEQYFPCSEEIDKIEKVACYSMGKLRRFVEASRRNNSS
jgi:hypothetical protein